MITWYPTALRRKPRPRAFPISVLYSYVRTRQLEQTHKQGPKVGAYLLNAQRISTGWGLVAANRWPPHKRQDKWPPHDLRPHLDKIARYNRRFSHFRIRTADEAVRCLAFHAPFAMAFPIHSGWRDTKDGRIGMPPKNFQIIERHAVACTGYDLKAKTLSFRNSWGSKWGDKGHGTIPFEYFDGLIDEAWAEITIPPPVPPNNFRKWRFVCTNHIIPVLDFLQIVCYNWDTQRDTKLGWAMLVIKNDHCELEDFFMRQRYQTQEHLDRLIDGVSDLLDEIGLPFRYWVPHCDHHNSRNYQAVNYLISVAGLRVSRSPERWASYKAEY